ncbi:MAG: hypothetical protein DRP45_00950 [Candidatus Zixiibacteriota bacterium]|nr:MAG: hypothetical protein DRP45_00950 [candidate division Zixibacteria bacterium]
MKANVTKTNFTAGELSPRLLGYVDFDKYQNGAKRLRNMVVHPHGGVTRRPGTQFIAAVKNDAAANSRVRLVQFSFSVTQNYILEFGHNYIRFYKEHEQIEDAGSPVEVASTYTEAEVFELKYVQSADKLFIVHPNHAPAELTRTSHIAWTLADMSFIAAPSEWTAGNYPSVVSLYQQRSVFAATPNEPQHVWGSVVGDIYDFTVPGTATDEDPFTYQIASDSVNAINWLSTGERITVGTVGAEFSLGSTRDGEALTATNVKVVRETNYGSARHVDPIRIDNSVLYVQFGERKIREHAYDIYSNGSTGADATIFSEHITQTGIIETAYQNEPDSILWALRNDGKLAGLTYERQQKILAWHQHNLGGTDSSIISVAATNSTIDPTSSDYAPNADEVWLAVERTIDGATHTYIETMVSQDATEVVQAEMYHLDCGLIGNFPAGTSTVSGLAHLEGETVQVVVDGATHPDRVVSSGAISLDGTYNDVQVGYQEDAIIETMPLTEGGNQGDAFMQMKRISRVRLLLHETLGVMIGPNDDELDRIHMGPGLMNNAPGLVTGIEVEDFPGDFEREGTIVIKQTQPLPLTVLALVAEYRTQ